MATNGKDESQDTPQTENVITRVVSLPLISSAYEICASLYRYAKENHPCINSAFSIAEMVSAVLVGSAKGGAQPILTQFEPQIATVNTYACKQLDKLEESLPYLHQPTHQVIEDGVTKTKSVICSTVTTARDAACKAKQIMDHRVAKAVDLTKDIVQDGVTLTKSVVNSTVNTAVGAASDAKELVVHRVSDAVNLGRETIQDTVDLTTSVVNSTVNTAVNVANDAKELMVHRVSDAVNLGKETIQDTVDLTTSVVNSTVNTAVNVASDAKELMTHRVSNVVNLGRETVQDTVDLTKSVVSSTVDTALQAAHGTKDLMAEQVKSFGAVQEGIEMTNFLRQTLTSRIDAMLDKTEEMVDHYLPMTDEELVKLATEVQGFDTATLEDQKKDQSYFVRLGSLSSKVRHRAYLHSLKRVQHFRENTLNTLSQLQLVISLAENLKQGVGQRIQETQEKFSQLLLEWTQAHPGTSQVGAEGDTQPEVESRTLAMLRIVTQELGPAYTRLFSAIKGLPTHIQESVDQTVGSLRQLHTSFSSVASLQDLSAGVLAQARERVAEAREALDTLVEYIVQNTPLNWIVGPFRPSPAAADAPMAEAPVQQVTKTALEAPSGAQAMGTKLKVASRSAKKELEGEGDGRKGPSAAPAEEASGSSLAKRAKKQVKEEGKGAEKKAGKSALGQQ